MGEASLTTRTRLPVTPLLGASMFFSGITYAATLPYASLVGIDTLGMSAGNFATVMAFGGVFGTLVSLALGYLSDKIRDRRLLVLIPTAAGVLANAIIYFWPSIEAFTIAMALVVP